MSNYLGFTLHSLVRESTRQVWHCSLNFLQTNRWTCIPPCIPAGLPLPGFLLCLYSFLEVLWRNPRDEWSKQSHQTFPAMKNRKGKEQKSEDLSCTEDASESPSLTVALYTFVPQSGNFWCAGEFNAAPHYIWYATAAKNVFLNTCAGADNCGNNVLVIYLLN